MVLCCCKKLSSICTKWMYVMKSRQSLLLWAKKLYLYLDLRRLLILASIVTIITLAILPFVSEMKTVRFIPCQKHPSAHNPDRFKIDNSAGLFHEEIVPNIIHFYRTGDDVKDLNFADALCLLAAFRFTNPDKIMIHTDDVIAVSHSFTNSPYGKQLMQVTGFKDALDIHYWPVPKHVFGIEFEGLNRAKHMSDVTRIRILRKYGGMFLGNRAVLLKDVKYMRHFEMVIFKNKDGTLNNNLIIAHRDSRMLDLWLKSYHTFNSRVPVHHETYYVRSLFLQKSTFYHKFENFVQEGDVNTLNNVNFADIYMLYLDSYQSRNDNDFSADFMINLVDKLLNIYK